LTGERRKKEIMKKVKALVVDDSAFNRAAISKMLASDADIEVVGSAVDGVDAISKTLRLLPDVITLDLEMPNMDGFTFLRWLMKERPTPVIVLSSRSDSTSVFRALEAGAVDFIAKPEARISRSIETIYDELLTKVRAVTNLQMSRVQDTLALLSRQQAAPVARKEKKTETTHGPVKVVAIASSTGGPPALQAILTALSADLSAAIVISQHMPPGFTKSFAERLNKLSALSISEAATGDPVKPGTVLIAPGGYHLIVRRDSKGLTTELVERSPADMYVPSADRMMVSVAQACGPAVLGVVLTGMGKDGVEGVLAIKKENGLCLAESEESAVVFGMPHEAIRTGLIDKVLPLSEMAREIELRCSPGRSSA
jgi:two-component system chemotaxis response regulator CheB